MHFFGLFLPNFTLQVVGVLTPTTWRKHPKFMKKLIIFLFVSISLHAQDLRVEPLSWWTGMKNTQLQLMVHGKDIKGSEIIAKKPGLKIVKVHSADSPNYLFIDFEITKNTPAGSYPQLFTRANCFILAQRTEFMSILDTRIQAK